MTWSFQHSPRPYWPLILLAAALSLGLAAPAAAQPAPTCNGLPATIVATNPGRIDGTDGVDVIVGTAGGDEIFGLRGDDTICGGGGDDTIVWNPGDGSDLVEGQAGQDTLLFNGAGANETIDISANGPRLRFFRDVASITMDVEGTERVTFNALGGADTITVGDLTGTAVTQVRLSLAATLGGSAGDAQADRVVVNGTAGADAISAAGGGGGIAVGGLSAGVTISASDGELDVLEINALAGADTINASALQNSLYRLYLSLIAGGASGGAANGQAASPAQATGSLIKLTLNGGDDVDSLIGSAGADLVNGGRGNDTALLGAGDDTFVWNPGEGSDLVEGEAGSDLMQFNGAGANETIDISPNGPRLRFFRDVGNIIMDTNDLELVAFEALGGADTITVDDLSGTDVTEVRLNLAATLGGSAGDTQPDQVIVNATAANDTIEALGQSGAYTVTGLLASVLVSTSEISDELEINLLAGNDTATATALAAGVAQLTIDGDENDDTITGSAGGDTLEGGDGADLVNGDRGDDTAFLGAGDDTFVWDPGDGSDVVVGQDGSDLMQFNGAGASENIDISANGGRLRFFRNVGSITMDTDDLERVTFAALGGADAIVVGNLSGTDVTEVRLDLAGALGGTAGDGQPDTVTVSGSNGDDVALVTGAAGQATVNGLAAAITLLHGEAASDRLVVNALAGDDVVDASGLPAGVLGLTADGGAGADVLIGSAGDDILLGGDGDDVLIGGPGVDILDGGPGDNVVIQD
jgi:Ca2+-binding RTX toxin-like protein